MKMPNLSSRGIQILFNSLTIAIVAMMLWGYHVWADSQTAAANSSGMLVSYQGTLADAQGRPVNDQVEMTFRLYNVATGGTPLWEETYTGDNAVSVKEGVFQVSLGSLNPIPANVWNTSPLYLGIQVGADPEMTPRAMVGQVPFALHVAPNAVTGESVADGSLTRQDFAAFTGVVWQVPPIIEREDVKWTPSDNAVWDIGAFLDEAGVPADAEVLLIGWRSSRLSDTSAFQLLDGDDNVLATVNLGTNIDTVWAPIGMEYGAMIPVPGQTRKIKFASHGGDYKDISKPRRVLYIFGWK